MITAADILRGKVLIVDDQETSMLLLEQVLCIAGYLYIASSTDPRKVYGCI